MSEKEREEMEHEMCPNALAAQQLSRELDRAESALSAANAARDQAIKDLERERELAESQIARYADAELPDFPLPTIVLPRETVAQFRRAFGSLMRQAAELCGVPVEKLSPLEMIGARVRKEMTAAKLNAAIRERDEAIEGMQRQAAIDSEAIARFGENPDAENWLGWRTKPDAEGRVFDIHVQLVGGETVLDRYLGECDTTTHEQWHARNPDAECGDYCEYEPSLRVRSEQTIAHLTAQLDAARKALERLRPYVRHDAGCLVTVTIAAGGGWPQLGECTCGLTAALSLISDLTP